MQVKLKKLNDENIKKMGNLSQSELDKIREDARLELQMLDDYKKNICDELVKYKESQNLSVRALAEKLETSSISQIQRILNGTANITADTVVKIAKAIGKKPKVIWE